MAATIRRRLAALRARWVGLATRSGRGPSSGPRFRADGGGWAAAAGSTDRPRLLAEAAAARDPEWLADQLREDGRLVTHERYERDGVTHSRRIGTNAADVLAAGEFNRFYCRGVCLAALESDPAAEVEVYRLRPTARPRPESEAKV